MMSRLEEIKAVGILDWIWFTFWLKRDEFSHRLWLSRYYPDVNKLAKERAHQIDFKIGSK
jgi:hypothetical protein